jgi:hypothetical protein
MKGKVERRKGEKEDRDEKRSETNEKEKNE